MKLEASAAGQVFGTVEHALGPRRNDAFGRLPPEPRNHPEAEPHRRWVRQDFRMRRKMFFEEAAKLAVEGPVHKLEVRRARCFISYGIRI